MIWEGLALAAVCLGLSFLFSGMEAGVFSLSRWRVRQRMKMGRPGARVLHGFLQSPENFLWTILVGNTLASFALISLMAAGLLSLWPGRPEQTVPLICAGLFLFYALGDLLPKMLFQRSPYRLSSALALPFRALHWLLAPLVRLVEWFAKAVLWLIGGSPPAGALFPSPAELKWAMRESSAQFSSEERRMIRRVLELDEVAVRTLTVPFARVKSISADQSAGQALELFRQEQISRLLAWEGADPNRHVAGILMADALLFEPSLDPRRSARDFIQPPIFLAEDLPLDEAMRRMQAKGRRVAVVVGRDQREIGILTLHDILTFIFGEIHF